ncbi:MAG: conjugal transfer protein TraN [Candidatus Berkiella sp.]
MKYGVCLFVLLQSTIIQAAIELSELPSQADLQAVFSSFENNPTQYLPHYTDNPAEIGMIDNQDLIAMPDLESNETTKIVAQFYKNNEAMIAQIKNDGMLTTEKSLTKSLSESLAAKYQDCRSVHCAEVEAYQEGDFKQAATNLAVVSEAAHQTSANEHTYSIFQGQAHECRKHGFGYLNCCSNSGWGQFVSQCSQQEIALRQAREKNTVIFLGTRKSGSKLKKKKYDVYCVFESKLARIIQEQGRLSQLYVGFGHAEAPNCRGISASELARINLDRVNLSEIYPAIASSIKTIDEIAATTHINKKIVKAQEKADANN